MSYLVLARKWRPKSLDDLIGQEHVTTTLKNAIKNQKIAHAYIFSGPRGVGKTSTARILAKALNCEFSPDIEKCNNDHYCSFCKEIDDGKSLDVLEIDAASHTSVNDIRELIENVKYLPTSGKCKIYIIDETHMLSQSAFNALLKTLEEPPSHVYFILATTEVHKIPMTILSRCQRFEFKRVSVEDIKRRLQYLASNEKIIVDDQTLYIIAQEADGSLRDAISLFDQLIATFGENISYDDSVKILGILERSIIFNTLKAILNTDPKLCIELLHEVLTKGINPKRFSELLLKTIRNCLFLKICGKDILYDLSDDDKNELAKIIKDENKESLEIIFNNMLLGAESIQKSPYPQLSLESTLIKLCLLERSIPIEQIIDKIQTLSNELGGKKNTTDNRKPDLQTQRSINIDNKEDKTKQIPDNDYQKSADQFIDYISSKKRITAKHIKQGQVSLDKSNLVITFDSPSLHSDYLLLDETKENIKQLGKEFFSKEINIKVFINSKNINIKEEIPRKKNDKVDMKKNEALQYAIDIFGGTLVGIKNKKRSKL